MGLKDLFSKSESLIAVDIGASGLKLVELDLTADTPQLVNIAATTFESDVFSNNIISKTEIVSERLAGLLEANSIEDRRVVTAMPGPSVFTKKIKMPKMDLDELASNIQFEAGNFIPHNIDAVKLDYHILGEAGKNQLDVLVVAVKNEIVDSFIESLALAGLEVAVADVDYFALQNAFEAAYPEMRSDTVALINIGARYTSINICRDGASLFTGDVAVGGKLFTEAIENELGVKSSEAEKLKLGKDVESDKLSAAQDIIDRHVEQVAAEFNRQLSFFWNASGEEDGIGRIMLTGGASQVPGLRAELSEKTGLACEIIDPFKGIKCESGFDADYLKEIAPGMTIAIGLGMRQAGDRIVPEFND